MKTIYELKALWNEQADRLNQWDDLGLDEIVHFAQQVALIDAAEKFEGGLFRSTGSGPIAGLRPDIQTGLMSVEKVFAVLIKRSNAETQPQTGSEVNNGK